MVRRLDPDALVDALALSLPAEAFPYDDLIAENGRRTTLDPEYELADTGVLDAGFWDITVDYAKVSPDDFSIELRARNAGAAAATPARAPDDLVSQHVGVGHH